MNLESEAQVEAYEKLETQLHTCRREINELSKKKPNDALNKFKLSILNKLLLSANVYIGDDVAVEDFTSFEVDQLPTNSDALFVLAQYTDALTRLRQRESERDTSGKWSWVLADGERVKTGSPYDSRYKG